MYMVLDISISLYIKLLLLLFRFQSYVDSSILPRCEWKGTLSLFYKIQRRKVFIIKIWNINYF